MDVHGAVDAVVVVLKGDPVLQGSHVVAKVKQPGGPHAREYNAFVGTRCLSHFTELRVELAEITPGGTSKG